MIKEFKDEYRFLSNFYPSPFEHDGITYPTVEHFFQAQKTFSNTERIRISRCRTPGVAKREGRLLLLKENWEEMKQQVMMLGLMYKFMKHPSLAEKLKQTSGKFLEEGNSWGDTYWGIDLRTRVGKNALGKMLMAIRGLLNEKKVVPFS